MMCYLDMTFCTLYKQCKKGKDCGRALTREVEQAAERWWRGPNAPIAVFANRPGCYEWDQPKKGGSK